MDSPTQAATFIPTSSTVVVQNCDELFDYPELSAAPDIGWPDIFNSGVFVFCPSEETFHALLQCALVSGSFDGGDQGLLNTFFGDWCLKGPSHRLPFIYNTSSSVIYSYLAAYRRYASHDYCPCQEWGCREVVGFCWGAGYV
ncbi:unnamed protein product [Soboliphyme baturini]|uniref:Polyprotein n=1 Tax=Soboliphyme baturini TaxID=241478 RepID=A0A183IJL1_9BILA|nr:unnamed protein product [Soboliphyme baturini]